MPSHQHSQERPLLVGVVGATGRLGSSIVGECARRGIPVTWTATSKAWGATPASHDEPARPPTVVIDASRGAVLPRTAAHCEETGAALVACASDLGPGELAAARELSARVPVVRAVNLSVAHWLQCRLVSTAARIARRLPELPAAAVLERHTAAKRDRPSATARALAGTWDEVLGDGATKEIASYRAGLPVSEHAFDLTFCHETLTLRHDVRDLGAAVFGALTAASWAHDAAPGYHSLTDLFDHLFLR
ncbi:MULTISPECIES: dihydrodipicolinate reductase C-terminal domain-containing protein [unclassified Streptomyces]|uniref:dihydrodipicolinate reductase C-terminal domain-containing protein n=1 Tax=unclassified Streptomyces TaxID=2593676 RepID=UPI00099846A1|nr:MULTISPECIES: dihydrodipicolinate reductase C-terminal domain-containing protein [unclassified Streptomyces]